MKKKAKKSKVRGEKIPSATNIVKEEIPWLNDAKNLAENQLDTRNFEINNRVTYIDKLLSKDALPERPKKPKRLVYDMPEMLPEVQYAEGLITKDQLEAIHPKSEAIKHDDGKPRMSLISPVASFKIAQVMSDGEKVYSSHNWRNGFAWSRITDAALRHIEIWNAGMDNDPDSGRSNLAHAAACIMMLLEFENTKPEMDDRYKLPKELLEKMYPKK